MDVRPYDFDQSGPELDGRYAQLRREAPVAKVRFPNGNLAWLVTGYEPARRVQSEPVFSRAAALHLMPGALASKTNLIMMDPPEHTRLRRLIGGAFSARGVEGLRPGIQQVTDQLLDDMAAHGPGADLVRHLSQPLPVIVICELLGIPEADRDRFEDIVDRHQGTTAYSPEEIAQATSDLHMYFAGLIAMLRQEQGRGLLGTLVRRLDAEDALSEAELADLAVFLLNAGHLAVVSELTSLVYYLLTGPDDLRRASTDPARLPDMIEESLRIAPLGGFEDGLPWIATSDVELGGAHIREGEAVYVILRAANRDERIWPDSETLDFTRASTQPHLMFGYGTHHCAGAALGRTELHVASATLLRRFTGLRLAVPPDQIRWTEGRISRRIKELPIAWDAHTVSGS